MQSRDSHTAAAVEELARGGETYVDKRVTEKLDSTGAVVSTSKSVVQRQARPDARMLAFLESSSIGGAKDWC